LEYDEITRKTKRGKVVYDRKKHFFGTRDLKRIAENTYFNWIAEERQEMTRSYLEQVQILIKNWQLTYYPEIYEPKEIFPGFGGGESGGGGAGDTF